MRVVAGPEGAVVTCATATRDPMGTLRKTPRLVGTARAPAIGGAVFVALVVRPTPAMAEAGGAGGAAIADLVWATAIGAIATLVLAIVAIAHRRGRTRLIAGPAAWLERKTELPGWSVMPAIIAAFALINGGFGFIWDVSIHLDDGRDAGPFANPSHYFIIVGLAGVVLAGVVSVLLGADRDSPTAVRLASGWYAPLGGLLILLCGTIAMAGFPLDDAWHRVFGQDVTLWGPTHVIMIAGGSLTTIGIWMLAEEGIRARRAAHGGVEVGSALIARVRLTVLAGAFFVSLSTLQTEFDFGVPQFRLLFQPVMFALAGAGLIAARIRIGRGGAIGAVAVYLVARGALTLITGPVFGHSINHFPLYLAEAALVELVALAVRPERGRQISFGALAGLAVGTGGIAAEWGWSHVWMPISWPTALFPEIALVAPVAAVGAGLLGGYIGRAMQPWEAVRRHAPAWLPAAAGLAVLAALAYPMPVSSSRVVTADVTLTDVRPTPERRAMATVVLDPPDAADGAEWLAALSYQGGGSHVDRLERIAEGRYRTVRPLELHGKWKSVIRLHAGSTMISVPVYLPADPVIPVTGVDAPQRFTRRFVADSALLRREEKPGLDGLRTAGYSLMFALAMLWIVAVALGLRRFEAAGGRARVEAGLADAVADADDAGRSGAVGKPAALLSTRAPRAPDAEPPAPVSV